MGVAKGSLNESFIRVSYAFNSLPHRETRSIPRALLRDTLRNILYVTPCALQHYFLRNKIVALWENIIKGIGILYQIIGKRNGQTNIIDL